LHSFKADSYIESNIWPVKLMLDGMLSENKIDSEKIKVDLNKTKIVKDFFNKRNKNRQ